MQQNIPSAATWWRLADTPDQTEMFFCVFFLILSINHIISQSRQLCQLGTDADWQAISGQVLELSQNKISKWEKEWRPCSKGWNVNILKKKKKKKKSTKNQHIKNPSTQEGKSSEGMLRATTERLGGKLKGAATLHYIFISACISWCRWITATSSICCFEQSKGHYVNSIVLQFH